MSDTEKQFQAGLRDVESKLKSEVESDTPLTNGLEALTSKDTVSISRECAKILLRDRYDMLMESWRKPLCDEWLIELSKALQQQEQSE